MNGARVAEHSATHVGEQRDFQHTNIILLTLSAQLGITPRLGRNTNQRQALQEYEQVVCTHSVLRPLLAARLHFNASSFPSLVFSLGVEAAGGQARLAQADRLLLAQLALPCIGLAVGCLAYASAKAGQLVVWIELTG
jgi:hypothetical protein